MTNTKRFTKAPNPDVCTVEDEFHLLDITDSIELRLEAWEFVDDGDSMWILVLDDGEKYTNIPVTDTDAAFFMRVVSDD